MPLLVLALTLTLTLTQVEPLGEERVAMQPGQFVLSDVVLQMEGGTPDTYACDCYVSVGKTARLAVMTPAALNSMNEVGFSLLSTLSLWLGTSRLRRKKNKSGSSIAVCIGIDRDGQRWTKSIELRRVVFLLLVSPLHGSRMPENAKEQTTVR